MINLRLKLFDLAKGTSIYTKYNHFSKLAKLSHQEIAAYQFQRIKALLFHAFNHSLYYQDVFREIGFNPNDFKHIEDLISIPVLKREDIQDNWEIIISKNYSKKLLYKGSSSGSTGVPIIYYKDKLAIGAGKAAGYIGWRLSGWNFGMKGLHLWGNPTIVDFEWKRLSSKLKALIFQHHKFPAYQLTDGKNFNVLYQKIKKGYEFIDGYTNAIYLFADYLKENGFKLEKKLKLVLTTAENLHDFQRNLIEEMVGPVYDEYGCSEINGIAYQCKICNAYHIIDPHVYVEYGDKRDDIGSCELIITDLDNFAFPLIRYKNDDLAMPIVEKKIDCTIQLTRIKCISGRESDILRFPDGGTLSVPSFFGSMLLKKINGLKHYQIEKISDEMIIVNFVKSNTFTDNDYSLVREFLDGYLNGRIDYEIKFVDRIEVLKSGKHKLLVDRTKKDKRV